ncbi:MAG: hypothetical protein ABIH67_05090 [Candidatus Uhrbacteria bacterium]
MAIRPDNVAVDTNNVIRLGNIPVSQQYALVFKISPPHIGLIPPDPADPTAEAEEARVEFRIVDGSNTSFLVDRAFHSKGQDAVTIKIWPNQKGDSHFSIHVNCDHPTDPILGRSYRVEFVAIEQEKEKTPHILDGLGHTDLRTKAEKAEATEARNKDPEKWDTTPDPMTLKKLFFSYPGFLVFVAIVLSLSFAINAIVGSFGGTKPYTPPKDKTEASMISDDDSSIDDSDIEL